MKRYFIGLDLSLTGTGICILNEEWAKPFFQTLRNKLEGPARLVWIREQIDDYLISYDPAESVVVVEDYAFGCNGPGQKEKGELHGVIKALLWEMGFVPIWVSPTSLKKFATGSGAGKKDVILKCVFQNWGYDLDDNNQADAAALAHIGRCSAGLDGYNLTQGETVDKILEKIIVQKSPGRKGAK